MITVELCDFLLVPFSSRVGAFFAHKTQECSTVNDVFCHHSTKTLYLLWVLTISRSDNIFASLDSSFFVSVQSFVQSPGFSAVEFAVRLDPTGPGFHLFGRRWARFPVMPASTLDDTQKSGFLSRLESFRSFALNLFTIELATSRKKLIFDCCRGFYVRQKGCLNCSGDFQYVFETVAGIVCCLLSPPVLSVCTMTHLSPELQPSPPWKSAL